MNITKFNLLFLLSVYEIIFYYQQIFIYFFYFNIFLYIIYNLENSDIKVAYSSLGIILNDYYYRRKLFLVFHIPN